MFCWPHPRNSMSFLINPWKLYLIFLQYPWKFHIPPLVWSSWLYEAEHIESQREYLNVSLRQQSPHGHMGNCWLLNNLPVNHYYFEFFFFFIKTSNNFKIIRLATAFLDSRFPVAHVLYGLAHLGYSNYPEPSFV